MTLRRQPAPRHARRPGATEGFVLTEPALLLVIAVLAGWLAVELLGRARQQWRCEQFVHDLRAFSAVFQQHAREPGSRLATEPDGTLPPALATRLRATNWFDGSPFGGVYEWRPPPPPAPPPPAPASAAPLPAPEGLQAAALPRDAGDGPAREPASSAPPTPAPPTHAARAAPRGIGTIALTAFPPERPLSLRRADLVRIDRQLDDGNPATGRFRTGFNGWPVYAPDGP
jgi:hypothetical protein